ncbi:sensor histidine kinase [Halopelagius fulvigenes]|uniref:histidine kinase n=1 Tax=Halopelagius fulvigenes TaxID=1198324 RepID=A0ABD5U1L6_9EURY
MDSSLRDREPRTRHSATDGGSVAVRERTGSYDSRRLYRVACVASLLVLSFSFVWVWYALGGPRTTQVFSDTVVALGAVAAALALTRLARRRDVSMRRGWLLLAVGVWLDALGEALWNAYSVLTGTVPYPGPPDVLYFGGYAFLAAGFVLFAVDSRDTRPRVRFTLDGLVVATALLTVGWHFVFEPLLATSALDSFATWVNLGYPVSDIVVASIGFVVSMNARSPRRLPLLLVAGGVFAWVVGDVAFAALEFGDGYVYDVLGLFWLLGYLTIAVGALHPRAGAPTEPVRSRQYEFHELAFPFLPFLLATGLIAVLGYANALDRGDIALAGLVVVCFVARQAYIFRDVVRLSNDLEASERTLADRNEELLLVNRIVRHDIRNDMAVANGWAGELRTHADERGGEMIARILRTTKHTMDLTETLGDFVEALDPDEEAKIEPTALRTVLQDALDGCRDTYPRAAFTVGDVPDVAVEANPLLGTVFHNLLSNAVQHNDTVDPRVDVAARVTGDTVEVRIADDGPGIPDESKELVFGRGRKGLDSPGSGVGLYLVDTLVDQYGGAVRVEDNDPRGAVFVVELNLAA